MATSETNQTSCHQDHARHGRAEVRRHADRRRVRPVVVAMRVVRSREDLWNEARG
jgi:hypothetical protein